MDDSQCIALAYVPELITSKQFPHPLVVVFPVTSQLRGQGAPKHGDQSRWAGGAVDAWHLPSLHASVLFLKRSTIFVRTEDHTRKDTKLTLRLSDHGLTRIVNNLLHSGESALDKRAQSRLYRQRLVLGLECSVYLVLLHVIVVLTS